jgi:ArsR family transcriptional regulator
MTDKPIKDSKNTGLPPEIERSLKECGGMAGLLSKMPDEDDIEEICTLHRVLCDKNRMKILLMLSRQQLCVCVIRTVLDIADSKLSYHLSVLKKNNLIIGEQQGNWIIYSLTEKGRKLLP